MLINEIYGIFKYFHFSPVLKNNDSSYYLLIFIIILIIYSTTISIIIMMILIKNKKIKFNLLIKFLKYSLPFFSMTFFGQIFLLLITIFDCYEGHSYVNINLKCRTGLRYYYYLAPMTIIALFLLVFISIITNILYFKPVFIKTNSDILIKINCIN